MIVKQYYGGFMLFWILIAPVPDIHFIKWKRAPMILFEHSPF